jgi:hypothetical protein
MRTVLSLLVVLAASTAHAQDLDDLARGGWLDDTAPLAALRRAITTPSSPAASGDPR